MSLSQAIEINRVLEDLTTKLTEKVTALCEKNKNLVQENSALVGENEDLKNILAERVEILEVYENKFNEFVKKCAQN